MGTNTSIYNFTQERQIIYKQLIDNGIGWNINYAKGTFNLPQDNRNKKFLNPKAYNLHLAITGFGTQYITVEGGKRGGKDVYALYSWAEYLMNCPNKLHLATGQTINHAIQTILEADGFGLRYLLPHGEKKKVDDRTIFTFMDFYGMVKEVHFFAGGEVNDREKFRGFNYGSHYANEAINQHINTIEEGKSRTNASRQRKIIHTQNPLAGEYEYYTKYERPLIVKEYELIDIYDKQEKYKVAYKENKAELTANKKIAREQVVKLFLKKLKLNSEDEINRDDKKRRKLMLLIREAYATVEKEYNEKYRIDYCTFKEYYENPNNVKNGLNFKYFHFTHDDNLAMSDLDRQKIEDSYDKTSIAYKRDIRGIRASSDNAVWDTLTEKNILRDEAIPEKSNWARFIVVDYGMKNAFVCIDCDVETDFTCKIWKEFRFDGKEQEATGGIYVPPTNSYYADEIEKMIKERNKGIYDAVIIDPSATGLINELKIRGIAVKKAINDVGKRRQKEQPDKKIDKSITGIWLVRDGFAKKKIFIHYKCSKGLNECYSYCLDPKQLAIGKEVPLKVNDHFPDCVRYLVNTVVKKVQRWGE